MTSAPAALTETSHAVVVRDLGVVDYARTFADMRSFTSARDAGTPDELWLVEHPPVFTLGTNAKLEPFANPSHIPIVQSDRGGDITYHGPGQLVLYTLLDLRRRALGVKALVHLLEQAVIDLLASHDIVGQRRVAAPGVYIENRKLAQLGLRVRHTGSYHGLSVNVAMDHAPFRLIKPCGYAGLETTDLKKLCGPAALPMARAKQELVAGVLALLGDICHESNTIPPRPQA